MALPYAERITEYLRGFKKPYSFKWLIPDTLGVFYANEHYTGPGAGNSTVLETMINDTLPEGMVKNRILLPKGHPTFEKGGVLVMTDRMVCEPDPFSYLKDET